MRFNAVIFGLVALLVLGVALRSYGLTREFILDFHAWRQSDTAAFTRGYLVDSFNPFDPSIDRYPCDKKGAKFGRVEAELPVVAWLSALPLKIAGVTEPSAPYLRSVSILLFVVAALYLFALVRALGGDERDALLAVAAFALLPLSIYFTRTPQPDGPSLALAAACLYHATRFADARTWRQAALAGTFGALLVLQKISNGYVGFVAAYIVLSQVGVRTALRDRKVWAIVLAVLVPVGLWHLHARSFAWTFGVWGDGADNKFSGASLLLNVARWRELWVRITFDELAPAATLLAALGLYVRRDARLARVALVWLGTALLFIFWTLSGQLRHAYYQLSLVLPVSIAIALAVRALLQLGTVSRGLLAALLIVQAMVTHHVLYAADNKGHYFAENTRYIEPAQALRKHLPEGALFVSTRRDPQLFWNSGHRGYFASSDKFSVISACMQGTTEWALVDMRARDKLVKHDKAFARTMREIWKGREYALFRRVGE
jgi:hypothetical protein